jgi:hypothetical protein
MPVQRALAKSDASAGGECPELGVRRELPVQEHRVRALGLDQDAEDRDKWAAQGLHRRSLVASACRAAGPPGRQVGWVQAGFVAAEGEPTWPGSEEPRALRQVVRRGSDAPVLATEHSVTV